MDREELRENLAVEMVRDWEIVPTGNGFMVSTDWVLPNNERIDLYVRTVGDRDDLYVVTDGGELFNHMFADGYDLTADDHGRKVMDFIAENYGAEFAEYQLVKGANNDDLAKAVRMLLEAVKEASIVLWRRGGMKEASE